MTTAGADQIEQVRLEIQEVRRLCLLLAADNADLRRTLAAAGIQSPASKLATGRWLTPKQYAYEHGIEYSGAMMRIRRGQVQAERHGGRWLINAGVKIVQADCTSGGPLGCPQDGQHQAP